MDARSHWKAWFDCTREDGARRVFNRLVERMDVEPLDVAIEPYMKGGFVARWSVAHSVPDWAHLVLETMAHAQRIGSGWFINGDVRADIGGWMDKTHGHISVAGVTNISWELRSPRT